VRTALAVGIAAVAVLAADLGALALGVGRGPEATARSYLDALANGDVGKAVSLSAHAKDLDRALLKHDLPKGSRLSHPHLGTLVTTGGTVTVPTTYQLNGGKVDATLTLTKHDGHWRVDNGLTILTINGVPTDLSSVTVNGSAVAVSAGGAELPAVPGLYRAKALSSFAFTGETTMAAVSHDGGVLSYALKPTPAGQVAAEQAVLHTLEKCFARTRVLENPCGTETVLFEDKADFTLSRVHWQITRTPRLTAFVSSGAYQVSGTREGTGVLSVFAVDHKHRFPPMTLTFPEHIKVMLAQVTFKGRTPTVTLA
jgi:hypothetical protein